MASHFSDLGFPTTTQDDVMDLVMRAATKGTSFLSPNGTYIFWSPGDGIELWVQTEHAGQIVECHPHFSGTSRMRVGVAVVAPDPDNPLEETPIDRHSPGRSLRARAAMLSGRRTFRCQPD